MWYSWIYEKWKSASTIVHIQPILLKIGTSSNQPEVSITSGSKVIAHYVIFTDFFKVTWRKNVTSYVKIEGLLQKRNSIRNVLQPTRSLYHFQSYGPLCDFHKSGDLDLDFYPISKKIILCRPWTRIDHMSKNQDDRSSGMACTSRTDGQTNKWKGTLRVHTLQNWTYRLSDLPCRLTVTKVKDTINWS